MDLESLVFAAERMADRWPTFWLEVGTGVEIRRHSREVHTEEAGQI